MKSEDTFNETGPESLNETSPELSNETNPESLNETNPESLNETSPGFLNETGLKPQRGANINSPEESGSGPTSFSSGEENTVFPPSGLGGYGKNEYGKKGYDNKSELWDYLRLIRPYVLFTVFIFALSAFAGYASLSHFPELGEMITESFKASFDPIMDLHPVFIMLFIFLNNSFVGLLLLILGLFLGIAPILIIVFNGFVVGAISHVVAGEIGIFRVLMALLPHGIVELPMIFLAGGIGLRLGHQVLLSLIGKPAEVKKEIKRGIIFYFHWVVPLLFVAAVIETFITPLVIQLFQS